MTTDQERRARTVTDGEFLARAAESVLRGGADGYRLTALRVPSRSLTFVDTGAPAGPLIGIQGPPADDAARTGRGRYDWQPTADSPPHTQLAWLLDDLAQWPRPLREAGLAVTGVDAPEPAWCDLLAERGGRSCRIRLALADRTRPLDFPGMAISTHVARPADPLTGVLDLRALV